MKTEKAYRRWQVCMKIGKKVCRCHQLPERSFFIRGYQFPLCARCTGIVLGFLIAPIITIFWKGNLWLSLALVAIMVADGLIQLKTKYRSTNPRRLLTGLGAGYAFFNLLFLIIWNIVLYVKK